MSTEIPKQIEGMMDPLHSTEGTYNGPTHQYPGEHMPTYTIHLPSSGSEVSYIEKLHIDMRTLVQTCKLRPDGFKFKGDPTQYALF